MQTTDGWLATNGRNGLREGTIMKAIAQDRYGEPDALELREVDRPVVEDDDVLVRVHAASANPYDLHYTRGLPYVVRGVGSRAGFGLRGPKLCIRGRDLAGQVEADGKVTPVIDRTNPLSECPDALRYLEAGHARGKVVITV